MPDSIQHQKDDAFLILGLLCVGLALVYVFQGMTPETWDFNMARRIPIVIALVLVGTAVGLSSVVFQTITTNYILTPSVMGLDNLYVLLQTLVLYFVGSTQLATMQSPLCFMGALLLMVCVSTGIFFYMFRGQNGGNIYFVVLVCVHGFLLIMKTSVSSSGRHLPIRQDFMAYPPFFPAGAENNNPAKRCQLKISLN